jgi:phosphoribosylanthranilate isomerase
MIPTKRPRVKICCIGTVDEAWMAIRGTVDEAWMAIRYGASALGLVSAMPSGPGVIPEDLIATIAARVPPPVATFLLTSRQRSAEIIAQQRRAGVKTIQIVDSVEPDCYADLRRALPGISLVQVVHVTGPEAVERAVSAAPHVDAVLLDSGNLTAAVRELGGTGRTHDWAISARIRELLEVPVFLAGGLSPENVGQAIAEVAPFAVDVCSGVRSDGKLDEAKLSRFFEQIPIKR